MTLTLQQEAALIEAIDAATGLPFEYYETDNETHTFRRRGSQTYMFEVEIGGMFWGAYKAVSGFRTIESLRFNTKAYVEVLDKHKHLF